MKTHAFSLGNIAYETWIWIPRVIHKIWSFSIKVQTTDKNYAQLLHLL